MCGIPAVWKKVVDAVVEEDVCFDGDVGQDGDAADQVQPQEPGLVGVAVGEEGVESKAILEQADDDEDWMVVLVLYFQMR